MESYGVYTSFVTIFSQNGRIGHFDIPIFAKTDMVLLLRIINGCVKYEFYMGIGVTVT